MIWALRGAKTAVAGDVAVAACIHVLETLVQCPQSWRTWMAWETRQRQVKQPLGNEQMTLSLSTLLCITQLRLLVSGQAIRTLDGEIGLRDRGGYK